MTQNTHIKVVIHFDLRPGLVLHAMCSFLCLYPAQSQPGQVHLWRPVGQTVLINLSAFLDQELSLLLVQLQAAVLRVVADSQVNCAYPTATQTSCIMLLQNTQDLGKIIINPFFQSSQIMFK